MTTGLHSGLTVATGISGVHALHSGLFVAPNETLPRAQHSGLVVIGSATVAHARHSGLVVGSGAASTATQYIKTAAGMVPLGPVVTTPPPFPVWGPYGELGAYVPWAETSGARWDAGESPGGVLTGDQIITVPGTIIQDREIFGRVIIRTSNVTVRRCRVYGSATAPTTNGGVIDCAHGAVVNAVIEDCTVRPQVPSSYWDGIRGHDYKARRNDVSGTTDGFSIVNTSNVTALSNVEIDANYIHHHAYRTDPQQQDGHTHNDGLQIHNCNGVKIRGNNFQSFTDPSVSNLTNPYASTGNQVTGQSILIQPQAGNELNILIQWNLFGGGGEANIHMAPKNVGTVPGLIDNVDIWGNRFDRTQRTIGGVKHTVRRKAGTSITNIDVPLTGEDANLYSDTLTPITVTS